MDLEILYVWSIVVSTPVGEILAGIVALKVFCAKSTLNAVTSYTPVLELIALVSPEVSVFATSLKVQLVVLSVEPTNTLKVPPAPVKLETVPSFAADTT